MSIPMKKVLAVLVVAWASLNPLDAAEKTSTAAAADDNAREVRPSELIQYPPAEKKRIMEWVYGQAAQLTHPWFTVDPKTRLRFDYFEVDRVVLSDALSGRDIPADVLERVILAVDKNYPLAKENRFRDVANELIIALRFSPEGEARLKKLLARVNDIRVKAMLMDGLIGALSKEEVEKLPKLPPNHEERPDVEQWLDYASALRTIAREAEREKELAAMPFNEKLDRIIEGGEFFGWEVINDETEPSDVYSPDIPVARVFAGWTPHAIFDPDHCDSVSISNFFTLRALFKTHRQEVLAYLNRTDIELCKGRTPREIQAVRSCVLHLLGEKTEPIPGDLPPWKQKVKEMSLPATSAAQKKSDGQVPSSTPAP